MIKRSQRNNSFTFTSTFENTGTDVGSHFDDVIIDFSVSVFQIHAMTPFVRLFVSFVVFPTVSPHYSNFYPFSSRLNWNKRDIEF